MPTAPISAAAQNDADGISQLHAQFFSPPWSAKEVAELMAHPGAATFVVRDVPGNIIVGYILGRVAADEAELLSVGVAPDYRRSGLARRLVHALGERVRDMGAAKLFLEVSTRNASAVALYGTLGFDRIGMRRGYYRSPGKPAEDALLLALDLSANPRVD